MTRSEVWFLDVGQGHATVVRSEGVGAVIDCPLRGVGLARDVLYGDLVSTVFVTHRDLDHCGGIPDPLSEPGASTVLLNYGWALPAESREKIRVKAVLSKIFDMDERGAVELDHGYQGAAGTLGAVGWELLAPLKRDVGRSTLSGDTNSSSMVVRLTVGGKRVLVTGDITSSNVDWLLDTYGPELRADVLLLPHHGAHLASLHALLDQVQPSAAVVSVGRRNGYGHPDPRTLLTVAERSETVLLCTQVNLICHADPLLESHCAGSVCMTFEPELRIQTVPSGHDERVSGLSWPVCVRRSLPSSVSPAS